MSMVAVPGYQSPPVSFAVVSAVAVLDNCLSVVCGKAASVVGFGSS